MVIKEESGSLGDLVAKSKITSFYKFCNFELAKPNT